MRQIFSYTKFNEEKADNLVLAFSALTSRSLEGQNIHNSEEYKEANALFSKNIVEYCLEGSGAVYNDLEDLKNPMVYSNAFFKAKFATILAQAITPVVPSVVSAGYNELFEVHQVGFGDDAKYTVESNELYIVNDIAEGIKRGGQQTMYNNEYSVTASRKQISVFVDWYLVASGIFDWGSFGKKVGASFNAGIQGMVVKAMTNVITDAAAHGIAGYIQNGFSDENWIKLARNVQLANGNSQVYALGTQVALSKILPEAAAFRFGPDSDIVVDGALPAYKRIPLVELDNALVPNTINGNPEAILRDDCVYMIAMGSYKPCKVVIEGNMVQVSEDPLTVRDHSYNMTIDMRIGADVVVGSKFGYMTLN